MNYDFQQKTLLLEIETLIKLLCTSFPRIASRLFTRPFIQAQMKEDIKAPRHWPLCWEFTGDRWISRTKGQWRGNISIWWRHHDSEGHEKGKWVLIAGHVNIVIIKFSKAEAMSCLFIYLNLTLYMLIVPEDALTCIWILRHSSITMMS